ncbi:MAG: sigma-70 family RNA polymerase sigma factor [Saprospiraceae bacterium]|nr:sigma-70 family RNA polymerase sigma factor [Saprospiraceae bacterium]
MSHLTDSQIVSGLLQQEDAVINYLYDEIGPKVKQYIISKGGSAEEANDIFQEGIVSAFINIKSGKYQRSDTTKFTTYLTQICKYKWYDTLKSAHKSKGGGEMIDVPDDANIVEAMELSERYSILHELIDQLGGQCKEILQRFYWQKESIDEISKALKMVPASVKNGKYRCMQKLKESAQNNEHLR